MACTKDVVALAVALAFGGCGDDGDDLAGWALGFGGTGTDAANAIAATPGGGAVVTGLFSDTVTAGEFQLTADNAWDAFVVQTNADGEPVWAQRLGSAGNDYGEDLAVDVDGSVVVIGSFAEKVVLGDDTLTTAGGTDIFVARIDAGGDPVWLTTFGSIGEDYGRAVAIADDGDILIAGEFTGTAGFDDMPVQSMGESDVFYARLGADGGVAWALGFGGRGFDGATAIAALPGGGFALAGTFEGDIQVGAQPLSSKGFFDAFVAGFDADGAAVWAHSFGDADDDFARAIAAGADGTVAVTGEADGNIDFGNGSMPTDGYDAYVATYAGTSGQPGWAHLLAGSGHGTGRSVAFDVDGNLDYAGSFTEAVALGAHSATSAGANDVVTAQLDPAGNALWLQRFGGPDDDAATAIAVDDTGSPVVAGYFEGTGNFAYAALSSTGNRDIFLLTLPQLP